MLAIYCYIRRVGLQRNFSLILYSRGKEGLFFYKLKDSIHLCVTHRVINAQFDCIVLLSLSGALLLGALLGSSRVLMRKALEELEGLWWDGTRKFLKREIGWTRPGKLSYLAHQIGHKVHCVNWIPLAHLLCHVAL